MPPTPRLLPGVAHPGSRPRPSATRPPHPLSDPALGLPPATLPPPCISSQTFRSAQKHTVVYPASRPCFPFSYPPTSLLLIYSKTSRKVVFTHSLSAAPRHLLLTPLEPVPPSQHLTNAALLKVGDDLHPAKPEVRAQASFAMTRGPPWLRRPSLWLRWLPPRLPGLGRGEGPLLCSRPW